MTTRDVRVGDAWLRVQHIRTPGPSGRAPIVFLHDSLGCIDTWRDFPARLGDRASRDVIVYDRRGYGQSSPMPDEPRGLGYLEREAGVLFALLDELEEPRAVLFGHSDGGSIALLAAAARPSRVEAVITEGAHVFVEEQTLAGIRAAQHAIATSDLRQRVARYHGDNTDGLLSAWIDTWLRPEFADWNIEWCLPDITSPTLVIQGDDDEFGTPAQVDAIVRGIGHAARGLMLPQCAHTPHREATAAVLDTTVDFLSPEGRSLLA